MRAVSVHKKRPINFRIDIQTLIVCRGQWNQIIFRLKHGKSWFELLSGFCWHITHWWERLFFFKSRSRLLKNQSWHRDWYRDFQDCSFDMETGIKTFRIAVLILRLVLRLSGLHSWYRDLDWDFQDCSLDIETEIKTFRIGALISRLVLKHLYFDLIIKTGTETFKT